MTDITLNHIARIEGHARLDLKIEEGKVKECKLGSTEGSRYFQGLLVGRRWDDAPEITSRICGICSSAHGVASVMALEKAFGVKATEQTIRLRELQTIGERIRSHAAHIYFLALPDYLGYKSAVEMAPEFGNEIKRALRLVKLGNEMVTAVSGRVMHQVATQVGGFGKMPVQKELDDFRKRLIEAKKDIFETAKVVAGLKYPEFKSDTQFFSLHEKDKYAVSYGNIKVGETIFKQENYLDVIKEYHEPYSNCNFVVKEGKTYYVGALARVNNNFSNLSGAAKDFCKEVGFKIPDYNSFKNNIAQGIELIHYWEDTIRILEGFKIKREEPARFKANNGHGIAANEAPRGTLWHEYRVKDGKLTFANVIAPTTQQLRNIQDDIAKYVQMMLDSGKKKEEMPLEIEKLVRSYDPCISCATHFLEINWK
ncbi:Ni/Fe hydrogenase subunit alpha [Candidatus Woesearchaeota archaeon]|nr:Ni/Fe hydrogenase subunit alpha [Candidatus Woesearchaeota archaeon]